MHLGDDEWIIVDSCRDQRSGVTAPLRYLELLGVDVATQVKLVVATHAHDDHIAGISEVLNACEQAFFVCSSALSREEFAVLMEIDHEATRDLKKRNYSEYRRVREIVRSRGLGSGVRRSMHAIQGRELYAKGADGKALVASVHSVSPSDEAVALTLAKLAAYLPAAGSDVRPPKVDPNELAVALWVRVGDHCALLGADLLVGPDGCGWSAVLASFNSSSKAGLYKVAHHGSVTAHHSGIWTDLLHPEPIAVLAPYRAGHTVPNAEEISYLCSNASAVFASADPKQPAAPSAVKRTAATLSQVAHNVREPWGSVGHVRARVEPGGSWDVQLASPATQLC